MRRGRVSTLLWLSLSLAWTASAVAQAAVPSAHERGKTLYETYCAVCHGVDGRADTPVGRMLLPHPRNFADPIEMARLTVDRIYHTIKEGRPGTAMAAWEQVLTETQIGDVIDYLRSLAVPSGRALTAEQLSIEVGRRIYERDCAVCHGVSGRADTDAGKVLRPSPSQFANPIEMARLDDGRMYAAIKLGRPGTAMGGWGELLSPVEIIDVMRYVRTLAQPSATGTGAGQLDLSVGQQVYRQHCVQCHGEKGDAQTPLGQSLTPHPRDFTQVREMTAISDRDLTQAIALGKPGTAMAPWRGVLNSDDIRRVVLYIRRTFQRAP